MNTIGFLCYTIYNFGFLSATAIKEYRDRFGSDPTIQLNDILFSSHALCLCILAWAQILYYGDSMALRVWAKASLIFVGVGSSVMWVLVWAGRIMLLDALYSLSFLKMVISVIKYLPQAIHNYSRKSTVGWSIENIILDSTGGIFSIMQVMVDGTLIGDWSAITGNPVKFCLGLTSLVFDAVFLVQHYILYKDGEGDARPAEEEEVLLPGPISEDVDT